MLVVGYVLFSTSSRNVVHPSFSGPLYYLERIHSFSWGSAVLVKLYRDLERAARKESSGISESLLVLMICSYE